LKNKNARQIEEVIPLCKKKKKNVGEAMGKRRHQHSKKIF